MSIKFTFSSVSYEFQSTTERKKKIIKDTAKLLQFIVRGLGFGKEFNVQQFARTCMLLRV